VGTQPPEATTLCGGRGEKGKATVANARPLGQPRAGNFGKKTDTFRGGGGFDSPLKSNTEDTKGEGVIERLWEKTELGAKENRTSSKTECVHRLAGRGERRMTKKGFQNPASISARRCRKKGRMWRRLRKGCHSAEKRRSLLGLRELGKGAKRMVDESWKKIWQAGADLGGQKVHLITSP